MKKRTAALGVGAVVAASIAVGGIAAATSGDDGESITGPEAGEATAAALRATDGGTANSVERDDEDGAVWEVEVTRIDGTTVDVRMDANYEVVVIDEDDESDDSDSESDDDGDLLDLDDGDESDEAEEAVTAAEASQATAAALKATKGGTADDVERDDENGAVYEVEVTRADGSEIDVLLDGNYKVVVMDEESDETD